MSSREQAQWEALLSSRCPVYINEDSARGQAGKSKTQDGAPQEAGTRHCSKHRQAGAAPTRLHAPSQGRPTPAPRKKKTRARDGA